MSDRHPLLPGRPLGHRLVERYHRPGYQDGHQHVPTHRASRHASSSPRRRPNQLLPDTRLPPPGTYPTTPFSLSSPDGFVTHSVLLLSPTSPEVASVMETARKLRVPTSHIPAEDIVQRALENRILTHVSDGPGGRIFALEAGREDVIVCLVEEMDRGWEFLGVGKGGSEGMVFLKQTCASGSADKEEQKKGKGKHKAGPGGVGGGAEGTGRGW